MRTIKEARQMLDEKKISSVELTEEYLKKIKANNEKLGAYITVCEEDAIAQAKKSRRENCQRRSFFSYRYSNGD